MWISFLFIKFNPSVFLTWNFLFEQQVFSFLFLHLLIGLIYLLIISLLIFLFLAFASSFGLFE